MIIYAKTIFDKFSERPFSEIDSIILSWLSYLNFPEKFCGLTTEVGMHLRDIFCAEYFDEMLKGVNSPEETLELLTAVVASPRFRDIRILCFEQELDYDTCTQFAAITYEIAPNNYYIAFRGTDCTFIGWKEDMRLALEGPISSQKKAYQYLQNIAEKFNGTYMVGGHSKGGNLAVYAAAKCSCEIQQHIVRVYSHDGPGFLPEELDDGFDSIRDRIHKTLPQSSMIGMIFEQECEYHIVKSREKGVGQHNLFSWKIEDGRLLYQNDLTTDAKLIYISINKWICEMNQEDREKFINVIFEILEETGVSSFDELGADLQKNLPVIAKKIASLDKETGRFLRRMIRLLAVNSAKSMPEIIMPQ